MKNYKNRAILHLDGDAFFASVEQVKNWRLKRKPIVTGGERFIAAAMSYEAKAKGITRGMMVADIRKLCPEVIIVASDYVSYAIFARRMFSIVRKYTPVVEEYSIDECFADITGLDEVLGISYEEIGRKIKEEIELKLGLTFGVGLAATKVLAKVGSKHRKPAGYTIIQENNRQSFLENLAIEKVWGIGTATTKLLRSHGILTAKNFAELSSSQLTALNISKPYREIHNELNGFSVLHVSSEKREMPKSIMSSRTFVPASRKEDIVFSHLSKNIEEACERLRFVGAKAKECTFFIKSQEFKYFSTEFVFETPTDDPLVVIGAARKLFGKIFKGHVDFRASGLTLRSLVPKDLVTNMKSLFDNFENGSVASQKEDHTNLNIKVDNINRKYGEHTIMFGSSFRAVEHFEDRRKARRKTGDRIGSDGKPEKTWAIPFLGIAR